MITKINKYYANAYSKGFFPRFKDIFLSKKPVVVYYGFLGDKNFGDEWVFESAKYLFSECTVIPLNRYMPIRGLLLEFLFSSKIKGIVIGGGTLIGPLFWYRDKFLRLHSKGVPVFVHGTGVHRKESFDQSWVQLLSGNVYGGVRGVYSSKNILDQGNLKINPIGDAAFCMYEESKSHNKNSNQVLVNLGTHAPYRGSENARSVVSEFIEYLLLQGYRPVYFPFHEEDVKLGKELQVAFPKLEFLDIPSTYHEVAKIFRDSTFAIGERLHFIVMAGIVSLPFYGIMYASKHLDYLSSIALEESGVLPEEVTIQDVKDKFLNRSKMNFALSNEKLRHFKNLQKEEKLEFIKISKK